MKKQIAIITILIIFLAGCASPKPASRALSVNVEPALTQVFDDPTRGVRLYYYDTAAPEQPTSTFTNTPVSTNTETPAFTETFTPTKTATLTPTRTNTPTATYTRTSTPRPTTGAGGLPYYVADRVVSASDYARLAGWGINTAVVSFDVNGSATTWASKLTAAKNAGVNIVIWPSDWSHPRSNCTWEAPYPVTTSGDISGITRLLDTALTYSNFVGIVNAQEPLSNCRMTFDEMAGLRTKIHDYAANKGRSIQVWNYIDNLGSTNNIPDDQIARIMDVAVIWQHCAGGAEGSCASAVTATQNDVTRAAGKVDVVFLVQTFTSSSPYNVKFTLSQLETYSCQFINTGLSGFGYYTWGADWWPDLSEWADLQPAVPWVFQNCTGGVIPNTPIAVPTNTPGPSSTPTMTRTATATRTATLIPTITPIPPTQIPGAGFTFVSMGDAQGQTSASNTFYAVMGANPNLLIFNGDLENDGVTSTELNREVGYMKNYNLFNKAFIVRGNHDDHVSGSAGLWETYFSTAPNIKTLPEGVTNYVALNSSSDYLTYSFDYGNARFIGLDVPGDFGSATSAEFTWLDQRLTDAESLGLTHAFLFWHGPEYCVESVHCSTSTRTGTISTNMSKLVAIVNKHPIVSATFHGHEHILGWVHMDNTRVTTLTRSYEEFITSPSSGYLSYYQYLYPARMDYVYPLGTGAQDTCYALVTVNGASFTVGLYKTGNSTPVWSRTFTK